MILAKWRFTRLCDKVYRLVRLDFLRISILTGNTGAIWTYDEFVLGFIYTRIDAVLQHSAIPVRISQRGEVLRSVLERLFGCSHSVPMPCAANPSGFAQELRFEDGVEFARRLDTVRLSNRCQRSFL